MNKIEWRDIPGYGGIYQCSNDGRVKSFVRGEIILKPGKSSGYDIVSLRRKNSSKTITVHRLVMITFTKDPKDRNIIVRHLDGNKNNNNLSNLAWGTYKDNEMDKKRHGTTAVGDRQGASAISNEQAINILMLRVEQNFSSSRISKETGISINIVHGILSGRNWKNKEIIEYRIRFKKELEEAKFIARSNAYKISAYKAWITRRSSK